MDLIEFMMISIVRAGNFRDLCGVECFRAITARDLHPSAAAERLRLMWKRGFYTIS